MATPEENSKLQVFDADALKKRVAESVAASFGMLVPQQQWDALVEREVKAFFEEPVQWKLSEERYYADSTNVLKVATTPFRLLVWERVAKLCREEISKALDSGKLRTWAADGTSGAEQKLGELLERKLEQLAPLMVVHFFRAEMATVAEDLKNNIRHEMNERRFP